MRTTFASPVYFPTLNRRQVAAYAIERLRRASRAINLPRLSLVPDKQEPPRSSNREGSTDPTLFKSGRDGRFTQSA
jgi:hypothetical protein